MITDALFNSSNGDFKAEARLSLRSLWTRWFTFCLSTSQCHGDGVLTTQQRHRASLNDSKLPVSSVLGGFLYLPIACFLWGSHGGVAPPHMGSAPPVVLALAPVFCTANPPVLASRCATSLWLSDSAVCEEGFSRRHGNWFILPPPYHSPL